MENVYTEQQHSDAKLLYTALLATPPDKRTIAKVMANTFISGMNAQERLMAGSVVQPVRDSACGKEVRTWKTKGHPPVGKTGRRWKMS